MKYILISDFESAAEFDDALYAVKTRLTKDSVDEQPVYEKFSDGDVFKIKSRRPDGADAIAFKDEWMYYDSKTGMLYGPVFEKLSRPQIQKEA